MKECPYCNSLIKKGAKKCRYCNEWLNKSGVYTHEYQSKHLQYNTQSNYRWGNNDCYELNRLADLQKTSNIIWLIIAILQILSVVLIVAGIWNIIAVHSNWKVPEMIRNGDPEVLSEYEGLAGLVIFGMINLIFGGLIGVFVVLFDMYIRDQVLKSAYLFQRPEHISSRFLMWR